MIQERWTKLWWFVAAIALALSALATTLAGIAIWAPAEEAVPRASQCDVYTEQGCAKYVVADGGELEVQSGGELEVLSGATVDFQDGATLGFNEALDMQNDVITNIGNAGTDFSADGGLTTAGGVTVTTGGLEVTAGGIDVNGGTIDADINTEHIMLPTVVSQAFTYTASAGGTVALFTIADGETWFVHAIFLNVTTDFDCTGDDCVAIIGDGADTDGFCVFADAELQAADTEQTGSPAGWQGLVAATMGVYLDGAVSSAPHVYAPSGADETVDVVLSAAGDDFSAGAGTAYIIYTRIQ